MVQVELKPVGTTLTISGQTLRVGTVTINAPVLTVRYPLSNLSVYADSVQFPQGQAGQVSLNYNAEEGALWRGIVGSSEVAGVKLHALSALARCPLESIFDPSSIKELSAVGQIGTGGWAQIDDCHLSPPSARVLGRLPPELLPGLGLKIKTEEPAAFFGRAQPDLFSFAYYGNTGEFYEIPFEAVEVHGALSKSGVRVTHFEISEKGSHGTGALTYSFATHVAHYDLTGHIDPLVIPWFGAWWANFFKPFGHIYPQVALELEATPHQPIVACGIASADNHHYKAIPIDHTEVLVTASGGQSDVTFVADTGPERLKGTLALGKEFVGKFEGDVYPKTLAMAYFETPPPALDALVFNDPPHITAQLGQGNVSVSLSTAQVVKYYAIVLQGLSGEMDYDGKLLRVNNLQFGFADGKGGGTAQISTAGTGYGSFWIRNASLGEWSLLGPLFKMLEANWLSFTSLRFNSADGSLLFEPGKVKVPSLDVWGSTHAASANGEIDTQNQTVNFSVKLKTLGGSKPILGLLAPVVQPFTSVLEAKLEGPLKNPQWRMQLVAPSLLMR